MSHGIGSFSEVRMDEAGHYINWTGRTGKKGRSYGEGWRFEVCHSSASGWYVFDNKTNRVVADGLGSLANATEVAKQKAAE